MTPRKLLPSLLTFCFSSMGALLTSISDLHVGNLELLHFLGHLW
jgi:hypothetical protein